MGAWDVGSFDNDAACDWGGEFSKSSDLRMVFEAFNRVLDEDASYIDGTTGCEALAACEVLARLKGNWGTRNGYSEAVDKWVEAHPMPIGKEQFKRARKVVDRITEQDSELFDELSDNKEWLAATADLRKRLAD